MKNSIDGETARVVADVEKAVEALKKSLSGSDFFRSVDELEKHVHRLRCMANVLHLKQTNRAGQHPL